MELGAVKSENPFFVNDLNSLCATCNAVLPVDKMPALLDIIPSSTKNSCLLDVLKSISDFNDNNGPQFLCFDCYDKLVLIHDFQEVCKKSLTYIKDYLDNQPQTTSIDEVIIKEEKVVNSRSQRHMERQKRALIQETQSEKKVKTYQPKKQKYCEICGKYFTTRGFHFHFHIHKEQLTPVKQVEGENNLQEKIEKEEYACSENTSNIDLPEDEGRHLDKTSTIKCNKCKENFVDERELQNHVRSHSKKLDAKLLCPFCGFSTRNKPAIKIHAAAHARTAFLSNDFNLLETLKDMFGVKQIICNLCGKIMFEQRQYRRHMLTHTNERPHQCEECGKAFRLKSKLKEHLVTHSADQPMYPCLVCGKFFNRRDNLRTHEIVHTGEKKYACNICDALFGYAHTLRAHISSKHSDVEAKS